MYVQFTIILVVRNLSWFRKKVTPKGTDALSHLQSRQNLCEVFQE